MTDTVIIQEIVYQIVSSDVGTQGPPGPSSGGGAGNVADDGIWNAAGDLAVGTGADTAGILSLGSALQLIRVNSGGTTLEYFTLPTYILASGATPLSGNWDAGSFEIRAQTFQSDVVTGTAPFIVASTTVVANLNADLLDGQEGSYYRDSANFTGTNWTDLTDSGSTTLHTHDHGALGGLTDDDHTQYLVGAPGATSRNDVTTTTITQPFMRFTQGATGTDADATLISVTDLNTTKIWSIEYSSSGGFAYSRFAGLAYFNSGSLYILDADASDDVQIAVPTAVTSYTLTLPSAAPSANQVLAFTDGSGTTGGAWPRLPDIGATFDGGGSSPTVNSMIRLTVGYACTVTLASLVTDAVDACTVTFYKYTPSSGTKGSPTTMGTISTSASEEAVTDNVAGWSAVTLAVGDLLEIKLTTAPDVATQVVAKVHVRAS